MGDLKKKHALIEVLTHGQWYWLLLVGPDEPVWRLGLYSDRGWNAFQVPEHGRTDRITVWGDKWGVYIHKWRLIEVHACQPPRQPTNLLWQAGEVQNG